MQHFQAEGRTPDGPARPDGLPAEACEQILHISVRRLIDQPARNLINPIHSAHTCIAMMPHLTTPTEFWQTLQG
jgi:hypothetical protein